MYRNQRDSLFAKITPSLRIFLTHMRVVSATGGSATAFREIHDVISKTDASRTFDLLASWNTIAELLHLDCRDEEALSIFQEHIEPLLIGVSDQISIALNYNRNDVSLALFRPHDAYSLYDYSRRVGMRLWDHAALLDAQQAAAVGKHYESLPIIWRQLHFAYAQGCWRAHRVISIPMVRECLALGLLPEAAFHAVISQDTATATAVGQALLLSAPADVISATLGKLLSFSNTRRLFQTACSIIHQMIDVIPDPLVDRVFSWLLCQAVTSPASYGERQTMESAWSVLADLGVRLKSEQAARLVTAASTHALWQKRPENPKEVIPVRSSMLKAIRNAAPSMDSKTAAHAADQVLQLALLKLPFDYVDCIETLCQLAIRGGSRLRTKLRKALYPKGQNINAVLLNVAHVFGQEIRRGDLLAKDAAAVAANVKRQVQRLPIGATAVEVPGTICTFNSTGEASQLVVHMVNSIDVWRILHNRHRLTAKALRNFISAILETIADPDNMLANKFHLVESLGCVGDVISSATARRIFEAIAPLANGEITESPEMMSSAAVQNPLNPFKIDTGKPTDLQGIALFCLASIDRDKPGVFGDQLSLLIEHAIGHRDSTVRAMSLSAAREASTIANSTFVAVVLASADPDPSTATAALSAIATKLGAQHDQSMWSVVLQALRRSAVANAIAVRRSCAAAVNALKESSPSSEISAELLILKQQLLKDRCFSVRRVAYSTIR